MYYKFYCKKKCKFKICSNFGLVFNLLFRKVLIVVLFSRHPDIKRQLCKKCRCVLLDNKTAKVKIKNKNKQKRIQFTCDTCKMKKEYPADKGKDHRIWLERPEAVDQVIS